MDRSERTRNLMDAVAGGSSLVLECIGWMVGIAHRVATGTEPRDRRIVAIFAGTAQRTWFVAELAKRGGRP